jgi:glycosyltransferase involved in cell wall biosynthesis
MIMPFFSVVIPTYNRADKVKQTIQSVLDQTYGDYEVLVMDDGSTDNTEKVVKELCDPRVRYEWAENSGGPATPRNRGIDTAEGDWICFLDADDLWLPNKLQIVKHTIDENPHCDVFCHNEILSIQDSKSKILRYGPYEPNFYRVLLTTGNRLSTSATTVRRDFLNYHKLRFNQARDYVIVEDYDLWLRIALRGARFFFIKQPLGKYIIEDGNISLNTTKMQHNQEVLLREHVYEIQNFEPDKDKLWRQIAVRLTVQYAKGAVAQRYFGEAFALILTALKNSPSGGMKYFYALAKRRVRGIK